MTESPVVSIEIIKEVPFEGEGDSLFSRLRNVRLRGFKDVKIYEHASFNLSRLTSHEIQTRLHTPQTRVYQDPNLDRIGHLVTLFLGEGIDILNLGKAYDYVASHDSGEKTEWTMMPPVVERFHIPNNNGRLDYRSLIGHELKEYLSSNDLSLNPDAKLPHTSESGMFDLINDGSHRIHYGFEEGGLTLLLIEGMTVGFPYYAAPQKYNVKTFATRKEALGQKETKVHVLESPGHKSLYRLFPSGGIKSGDVRPH